ncbi:unnamed protein product, partial [Symbiodinium sp. CCMP2456]
DPGERRICNEILAVRSQCREEATGEELQRNMQKFGQPVGDGAQRYELFLIPSVLQTKREVLQRLRQ